MKKAVIAAVAVILAGLIYLFIATGTLKRNVDTRDTANRQAVPNAGFIQKDTPPTAHAPAIRLTPSKVSAGEVFFDSIDGEEPAASRAAAAVHAALERMCGMKNILLINNKVPDNRLKYMMDGTVAKAGDTYRIVFKVKDCVTSKIIYRAREDVASEAEIDAACGRLLNKIRIALM